MSPLKGAVRSRKTHRSQSDQLQDEVYRQMFRLEESRPGSELGLALALLRAWLASASKPASSMDHEWLQQISPICLAMIEACLQTNKPVRRCVQ